jgi:hypothetical protein
MITIFNIQLFGDDALWFCSLSKKDQTSWIKANTNQKSAELIKEFVDAFALLEVKCANCNCK